MKNWVHNLGPHAENLGPQFGFTCSKFGVTIWVHMLKIWVHISSMQRSHAKSTVMINKNPFIRKSRPLATAVVIVTHLITYQKPVLDLEVLEPKSKKAEFDKTLL